MMSKIAEYHAQGNTDLLHEKFLCAYKAVYQCMREAQVFAERCETIRGRDRSFWIELPKWPFTGTDVTAQDTVWTYVLNLTRECPLEADLEADLMSALKKPEEDFPKLWALMLSWHDETEVLKPHQEEEVEAHVEKFWRSVRMIWFQLQQELQGLWALLQTQVAGHKDTALANVSVKFATPHLQVAMRESTFPYHDTTTRNLGQSGEVLLEYAHKFAEATQE